MSHVATRDDTRTRFIYAPVEYRGSDFQGVGFVSSLSLAGARIEKTSVAVSPGTTLGVRFSIFSGSFAHELPGEVVQVTDMGFEVRFLELKPDHLKMLSGMGFAGDPKVERRAAPRVCLLRQTDFWAEGVVGQGVLHDLSSTGARIEEPSSQIERGEEIDLTFALHEDGRPIRIRGTVVRETETGFGVQFIQSDRRLTEWIELAVSQFESETTSLSPR